MIDTYNLYRRIERLEKRIEALESKKVKKKRKRKEKREEKAERRWARRFWKENSRTCDHTWSGKGSLKQCRHCNVPYSYHNKRRKKDAKKYYRRK